jgi:flagellar basal body-associated protein FliL
MRDREDKIKRIRRSILWAIMSILAVIVLADLFSAIPARADDRKTRFISFLSSGTYTVGTAQSTAFDVSAYTEGQIFVNVTTKNGSSTLDISIQLSPDNLTWYTHTAMTQITATGQYRQAITNFGKYVRISYVVGVTSYVFDISGIFKN